MWTFLYETHLLLHLVMTVCACLITISIVVRAGLYVHFVFTVQRSMRTCTSSSHASFTGTSCCELSVQVRSPAVAGADHWTDSLHANHTTEPRVVRAIIESFHTTEHSAHSQHVSCVTEGETQGIHFGFFINILQVAVWPEFMTLKVSELFKTQRSSLGSRGILAFIIFVNGLYHNNKGQCDVQFCCQSLN